MNVISENIKIKSATLSECSIIHDLAYQIWPDAYSKILSREQIDYMLKWMYSIDSLNHQINQGDKFFIAFNSNLPLGFASVSINQDKQGIAKLNKLYVLTSWQKRGLGQLLLNKVIEYSKQNKQIELILNVNRHNTALNFYLKSNFKIIKSTDIQIGNGFEMNDYIMSLKL